MKCNGTLGFQPTDTRRSTWRTNCSALLPLPRLGEAPPSSNRSSASLWERGDDAAFVLVAASESSSFRFTVNLPSKEERRPFGWSIERNHFQNSVNESTSLPSSLSVLIKLAAEGLPIAKPIEDASSTSSSASIVPLLSSSNAAKIDAAAVCRAVSSLPARVSARMRTARATERNKGGYAQGAQCGHGLVRRLQNNIITILTECLGTTSYS